LEVMIMKGDFFFTFKATFVFLLLNLCKSRVIIKDDCVPLYNECKVDADCCGQRSEDKNIRCEMRHSPWGKRCYEAIYNGMPCEDDFQCLSQHCVSGYCTRKSLQIGYKHMKMCEITTSDDVEEVVNGYNPMGTCPCVKPRATLNGARLAIDHNLSTEYVNYHTPYSGLIINPTYAIPVKKMRLCSASDCTECDPLCYKIEAKNDEDLFAFVQKGRLNMRMKRKSCIDVPILGRQMFKFYNITFGCRRGGYVHCDKNSASCKDYAIKISEISLWGACE